MNYSWQESNWQQITSAIEQQHLSHALLFYGQEGLGKLDFAHRVARYLLCSSGSNCGNCQSCELLDVSNHPDLKFIQREAGNDIIKVDVIRNLRDWTFQHSYLGKAKVVIIEPAEKLGNSASNALLKMLEEPPEDTFFILVSHHLHWLSLTIRSRCQNFYFKPASYSEFKLFYGEDDNLKSAFLLSGQAPLRASQLRTDEVFNLYQELKKSIRHISQGVSSCVEIAEKFQKQDLSKIIELLLYFVYQQIIELKANKDKQFMIYEKLLAFKEQLKTKVSINKKLWLTDLFLLYYKD